MKNVVVIFLLGFFLLLLLSSLPLSRPSIFIFFEVQKGGSPDKAVF